MEGELRAEELSNENGLVRLLALEVEDLTRFELSIIVDQIRSLNGSIAELEKVMEREAKR
jgi:hypothetical protein